MSLFAIADTHLSFGTDKPMAVFQGWAGFEKKLEKNWRALVKEEDTVVIAGDISWGMTLEEALPDFRFLHSLPGQKLLIKGNHDYWWNSKTKMENFLAANGLDSIGIVHNNAFQTGPVCVCGTRGWAPEAEDEQDIKVLAREAGRLRASLDFAESLSGEDIVFLHYPPVQGDIVCSEIAEVLVERGIKRCYFGHLHAVSLPNYTDFQWEGIGFKLISADFLEFCPKLIEKY